MNAMFYLIRKQLKNIIRGLARKPLALIGYILIGIFLVGFLVIALIMPSGAVRVISNEIFSAAVTGFILVGFYVGLRQGIEKGSTYFRFSDVNLVFTAPLRPSRVLLYGFIKRIGVSLFVVMITVFQIPNIKNNFVLADYGILALITAVLFYSAAFPVLGMVVYSITSKNIRRRVFAKRLLDVSAVLFVLFFVIKLAEKRSLGDALVAYLNTRFFSYIPVAGQIASMASAAVYGIDLGFFANAVVLVLIIGLLLAVLSKLDLDYYEDVLSATEEFESKLRAKREGRDVTLNKKKVRNVKGGFSGYGARTIFEKHMLEYRKASFFLFFDKATLMVVLFGIGFKFLMGEGGISILVTLFFSAYMLFFFVVQGKWPTELGKPYIFLIPESNVKKLFYSTLTENVKNLLDGAILFAVSYFFYNTTLPVILLCIISYTLYGAVYIYGDIVSLRLFGKIHNKVMQLFLKLFVSFIVVLPGIFVMIGITASGGSEFYALLPVIAWNLIVVICLFIASVGVFKNM